MIGDKIVWLDDEPETIKEIVNSFIVSSESRYDVKLVEQEADMFSFVNGLETDQAFVVVDLNIGGDKQNGGLELAKRLDDSGIQFIIVSAGIPTKAELSRLIRYKNFINFFSKNSMPNILGFQINAALIQAIQRKKTERAISKTEVLSCASGILMHMRGVSYEDAKAHHQHKTSSENKTIEEWCGGFIERFVYNEK